jgi:hypothetical protein
MARFFGKNNTTQTRGLMGERTNYYTRAFERDQGDNLDIKPVVDFNFAERVYYGRVDPVLEPVYPNSNYIKYISHSRNPQNAPLLMDFVSDMYNDLSNQFFRSCKLGQISQDDPYFTDLAAFDSFVNPEQDYRNYLLGLLEVYNDVYLQEHNRANNIKTIEDYISMLFEFSKKLGSTFPITFSGFMLSTRSSIFSSGLAVTIADLPMDVDKDKDDLFILNKNFSFYLNMAKNHGFSVNKNVPFMMVADLNSPITKQYMAKYLVGSTDSIFTSRYKHTYTSDFDKLLTNIITSYRVFVNKKSYIKLLEPCNGITKTKIINKENINNIVIERIINNNRLLINIYNNIRNIEEDKPFSENDMKIMNRDALRYEVKFGLTTALQFISEKYTKIRKLKDGGTISFLNKQRLKKDLTNKLGKVIIY